MTAMKHDIYTADGAIDMQAVDAAARQMRADATRAAVVALIEWFKPKSGAVKGTQSA